MRRSGHRQWLDATRSFYYSSLPPSSTIDQPGLVDACACASPLMDLVFHPLLFYREQPEQATPEFARSLLRSILNMHATPVCPLIILFLSPHKPTQGQRGGTTPTRRVVAAARSHKKKQSRPCHQPVLATSHGTKKVGHTVPAKRKRRPPRSQHERPGRSHLSLPATVTY